LLEADAVRLYRDDRVIMKRVCEVCHQPIGDEEQWFRVREEYVHLLCSEKYLHRISERRKLAKAALPKPAPATGG
jgi:hypothetical protein